MAAPAVIERARASNETDGKRTKKTDVNHDLVRDVDPVERSTPIA